VGDDEVKDKDFFFFHDNFPLEHFAWGCEQFEGNGWDNESNCCGCCSSGMDGFILIACEDGYLNPEEINSIMRIMLK
jgi:hypothetical protein